MTVGPEKLSAKLLCGLRPRDSCGPVNRNHGDRLIELFRPSLFEKVRAPVQYPPGFSEVNNYFLDLASMALANYPTQIEPTVLYEASAPSTNSGLTIPVLTTNVFLLKDYLRENPNASADRVRLLIGLPGGATEELTLPNQLPNGMVMFDHITEKHMSIPRVAGTVPVNPIASLSARIVRLEPSGDSVVSIVGHVFDQQRIARYGYDNDMDVRLHKEITNGFLESVGIGLRQKYAPAALA